MRVVIFLLMCVFSVVELSAQQSYNNCNQAFEVCPNNNYTFNNLGANITFCGTCEDNFNFCFAPDNTIWISFTTNATGGAVQADFSNLVFETNAGQDFELQATIIQAASPCDATTYTQIGNCVSNEVANFSLNAAGLLPNTQYYIVVDGDNNGAGITSAAECTFDFIISGAGIDRPIPTMTINNTTPTVCLNDIAVYTADTTNCPDGGPFDWYVNGVLAATTPTGVFQSSGLMDGDIVSVQTTCYLQCVDTVNDVAAAQSVYVINLDAGVDLTIQEGEAVQLFGSTTAPVYYWTPSFLVSNSNVLNPITNPTETTVYTLTAEENGCTLSDQMTVFVETSMVIPNTISPNDDGNNDTWVIKGIEKYPDNIVKIYDRWGQLIFTTSSYSLAKAWDGKIRGRLVTESVYYYVIELNNDTDDILKGSLTVIK